MLIVLSPAKNLQTPQKQIKHTTSIEFPEESKALIAELRKYKPEEISELMKLNAKLAELNFERYLKWEYPFKSKEAAPAVLMFDGMVYKGLQSEDFSDKDMDFAQKHLRILSGLYGIIKPADMILPYRLEMGTKLMTKKGNNLYKFWGEKLSDRINEHIAQENIKTLVNLASNEYFKALKPKKIKANIITPVFKEQKGNDFKTIVVYAKKARGLMSRYIIKNALSDLADLKGFDYENYSFNHALSSDTEYVFTR